MTDTITLHKDGTGEREIKVSQIVVPDLWHIAQYLISVSRGVDLDIGNTKEYSDMILECWHLAHAMKDHLQQQDHPNQGLIDAAKETEKLDIEKLDNAV